MGRRSRSGRAGAVRRRLLGAALPVLGLLAGIDPALAARLLAAQGAEAQGYGRIVLTFDKPVSVKATVAGGVLILGYGERSAAGPEHLATEMPSYLAAVRRDPDGSGLRLALQRPFRTNVQQAGERVFVDLLPESWRGLLPPLPPEVVTDLARRARTAEEALKARAPAPQRRRLVLELARLPTLTRLSLRLPDEAVTTVTAEGPATRLRIAGAWSIDPAETAGRSRPGLAALAVEADDTSASLILTPADGFTVASDREDGTLTLDIVRRAKAKPDSAKPDPAKPDSAKPEAAKSDPAKSDPAKSDPAKSDPAKPDPAKPDPAKPDPVKPVAAGADGKAQAAPPGAEPAVPTPAVARATDPKPVAAKPVAAKPVDPKPGESKPVASRPAEPGPAAPRPPDAAPAAEAAPSRRAGSGLAFPFARLPAAALFERGGVAVLAFETADPVAVPPPGGTGLRALGEPVRAGPLTVLRFAVPAGRLIDLAAVSTGAGVAWELSAGEAPGPSLILEPVRRPDPSGRVSVALPLPRPGAAGWLDLDGERVAVVPSAAREAAGNPRSRRFVDFEILPSRHGVAVLAGADDLAVRPDLDGVIVYREGGLSASTVARRPDAVLAEAGDSAIDRAAWERARTGTVRDTLRALNTAAAVALPADRGLARLALARAYLANGFDPEALAVLAAAAADDPLLAAARDTAILRGLALNRLGRGREALAALSAPPLAADPEAALWRAVVAAGLGDWKAAETGFLKVLPLADRYPDDLAALVRVAAAEAAIETGDAETAAARAGAGRGLPPYLRDRLTLVRARVAEATGQSEAAIETYAGLAAAAERPVAVAAALRGTLLARGAGKLDADTAIERLERLSLTWHGGAIEEALIAGLARLYLGAGRWRDAFATVRRANELAPNADVVRALTAEAQTAFDDLYLGGRGDAMPGVEAVALFFDFRELAPIGRRGDAVVRRLADRLVALDLLDPAAELLQYQIDHRLTGPARAAVAARLATVRLMDGQPMRALEALEATEMPELPGELRRARGLVRARALSDLTRTDLALEALEDEAGPEVERLRADILWSARRWREAGEAHEALLGDAWRTGAPLDAPARADAIRAAIAYDLAGEAMGLERLKAKFAGPMARGPDARTFALLIGDGATRAPGFREIAARATKAETLSAFLAEYRKRYPDAAVPDRAKAAAESGDTASRADAPAPAPPG